MYMSWHYTYLYGCTIRGRAWDASYTSKLSEICLETELHRLNLTTATLTRAGNHHFIHKTHKIPIIVTSTGPPQPIFSHFFSRPSVFLLASNLNQSLNQTVTINFNSQFKFLAMVLVPQISKENIWSWDCIGFTRTITVCLPLVSQAIAISRLLVSKLLFYYQWRENLCFKRESVRYSNHQWQDIIQYTNLVY